MPIAITGLFTPSGGADAFDLVSWHDVENHNWNATVPPTVTDDSHANPPVVPNGYVVGSLWIDTTHNKAYVCLNNAVGAAVWTEITVTTGGSGSVGPAGIPGFDGVDGLDGLPLPGPPGASGSAGVAGVTGPPGFGLPGLDGADGIDGYDGIPGAAGAAGATGSAGDAGAQGLPGFDGVDGLDGFPIPGPPGAAGATGGIGAAGPMGPPGLDGLPSDDPIGGLLGIPTTVTNKRLVAGFIANAATASTTVPSLIIGPMPVAGTIDQVTAKLGNNETCGATSIIFDVHKILAANVDTDGQGTTIYTTQANRPTIANTHKATTATAPDVTALAQGDYLAVYVDQAGTGVTQAEVSVRFDPT